MTKFKITRERILNDELVVNDKFIVEQFSEDDDVFSTMDFSVDLKDLPDLIKALQDKQKEIEG